MENNPSMRASSRPSFMRSAETRSPVRAPRLSTMIDLPEPVSPVSRLRPGPKSSSSRSINAIFSILRSESTLIYLGDHSVAFDEFAAGEDRVRRKLLFEFGRGPIDHPVLLVKEQLRKFARRKAP